MKILVNIEIDVDADPHPFCDKETLIELHYGYSFCRFQN